MKKIWKYPKPSGKLKLSSQNPLLASLLLVRGIDTNEKADNFLNPEKTDFIPFSVFKMSEQILERISYAISNGEKVVVYGDFDTDGVTSTAIVYKTLTFLGANVGYYLPDRDSESHGLNNNALLKLISKQKAKLIISVDCGVSDCAEVKLAKTFKTDVIITDHHEAPSELPEAFAIINPKAKDVLNENTKATEIDALCDLSGAGIAFKLCSALLEKYNKEEFIQEILPVAALGTIGDIVPLLAENRHIVYSGMKAIKNKINKGLTKLFENAGINDFSRITSETIAFTAVPRINAAGRLDTAEESFKLLISDDDDEIDRITKNLNEINKLRQDLCEEAFVRAKTIVENSKKDYVNSIVICDDEAHIGIIGLSASRLVETYNVPAFIMRKDENIYRCSCRGPKGVNIYNVLNENKDLFLGFGGHEFAGGFSFDAEKVSFENVKTAINETVKEQIGEDTPVPFLNIDQKLTAEDISEKLIETVKMLEPFGAENPSPIFSLENCKVSAYKFMGAKKNHLKLICSNSDGKSFECIKWSTSEFLPECGEDINIAFCPEFNEFNGKTTIQLLIKDMLFPNFKEEEKTSVTIVDNRSINTGFEPVADYIRNTSKTVGIYVDHPDKIMTPTELIEFKNNIFNSFNMPENPDVIVFMDFPPSLEWIKTTIKNGVKTIILMDCKVDEIQAVQLFVNLSGMLRYAVSKKNSLVAVTKLAGALSISADILLTALNILKAAEVLRFSMRTEDEILIENIEKITFTQIKNVPEYQTLTALIDCHNDFIKKLKNLSYDELKKYILN